MRQRGGSAGHLGSGAPDPDCLNEKIWAPTVSGNSALPELPGATAQNQIESNFKFPHFLHISRLSHYHGIWEFHILMGVSWSWYSSILKVSSWHGTYNNSSIFSQWGIIQVGALQLQNYKSFSASLVRVKGREGGHGMACLNFR